MAAIGKKAVMARLVLGPPPKADLLPPEVGLAIRARSSQRMTVFVVAIVVVVIGLGYGAAAVTEMRAQGDLNAETARTATLLASQSKYAEVRSVNSAIANTTVARTIGSSTSIDWQSYIASIQGSLPSGTRITTFTAKSGSPIAAFVQPTVPLQGERLAELTFVATSPSLPDVQNWLNGLATLKGFVDALPGTVTLSATTTPTPQYQVGITMHINEQALDFRYATQATKDAAAKAAKAAADAAASSSTQGSK